MPEFGLSRTDILRGRKELDKLFADGKKFYEPPFKIVYQKKVTDASQSINRVGVSVPKKIIRLAHDRNRIKRLCRESIRLNRKVLIEKLRDQNASLDFFIIYTGQSNPDFNFLSDKIILILHRLLNQV
jgi:ribonuclease P protein component